MGRSSGRSVAVAAAVLSLIVLCRGQTSSQTFRLPVELPVWAQHSGTDFVLDFKSKDPGTKPWSSHTMEASYYGKKLRTKYEYGTHYGNVAIVRYGINFVATVRKTHFFSISSSLTPGYQPNLSGKEVVSVWQSSTLLCSVNPATLQPSVCSEYDPRTFDECQWQKGFEGTGVEDTRLVVWPGRGLFAMFNSKPPRRSKHDYSCFGPFKLQPLLALLQPAAYDLHGAWIHAQVVPLVMEPSDHPTQKNWNPFTYKGQLYLSQGLDPHIVLRAHPNGTCLLAYKTPSHRVFRNFQSKPRGNTNVVLVPAAFSGEQRDFFLGVLHQEVNRTYVNYLYKMQARPPFRLLHLSRPLDLVYGAHPRVPHWERVAFPLSLELLQDYGRLLIGYGSGDKVPRVKVMPWSAVVGLFW